MASKLAENIKYIRKVVIFGLASAVSIGALLFINKWPDRFLKMSIKKAPKIRGLMLKNL